MLRFVEDESMPSRIRVSALAAVTLAAVCGTPASSQTMTESLAAAYSTNPQLNVARAQLRSVDEDIAIARSFAVPPVTQPPQVNPTTPTATAPINAP